MCVSFFKLLIYGAAAVLYLWLSVMVTRVSYAVLRLTAVSVYFSSKHLLLFALAGKSYSPY